MSGLTIENVIENSNKLTIFTAKKTVVSLYDYLHIKGLYLFAKIRPEDNTLAQEDNIEFIVNFLDKTNLKNYPFWCRLEKVTKRLAARFFTLRDESDMTLISSSKCMDAGIFILLSGKGDLVTVDKENPGKQKKKLKHGDVVGPTDLFNAESEEGGGGAMYTCKVSSGSVLQLKYQDLQRAMYGDRSVSADPNEGMTPDEVCVRDVGLYGESRLSAAMYQFLRKNHLLAGSEKDVSFKYIKNGSIGRSISGVQMENELVIVLDGSVRVVFGHNKGQGAEIRCTQPGQKSATFKVQHFPLSILEDGSLLHLDEKILSSGGRGEGGAVSGRENGGESEEAFDQTTPSLAPPSSSLSPELSYLQHISLQFDKPTTYLSIPMKKFRNALQNETHRVNIDIHKEVGEVVRGLAGRMEKLKPLMGGGYVFSGKKIAREEKLEEEEGDIINGDLASAESSLAGAYGIFSKLDCSLKKSSDRGE